MSDTREQHHDRHDLHIATRVHFYGPIILYIGGPLLALGVFIFGVYVVYHWQRFVGETATMVDWLGMTVSVAASIFLVGCAFRWVGHPIADIAQKIALGREAHAKAKQEEERAGTVLVEQETYVLVKHSTGQLELLQPVMDQYRYNIKVPETTVAEVKQEQAPSARELVALGTLDRALANNTHILGIEPDGSIAYVPDRDFYNLLLVGIPGSGKTTTGLWLAGQRVKAGGQYMVSDPHYNWTDTFGRLSLGQTLEPYGAKRLLATDDGKTSATTAKLTYMLRELARRKKPGFVAKQGDVWLWIMDEFNSIIDAFDTPKDFAQGLALLQREGRKFGLHTMILGHRFGRDDIGGQVRIRSVVSNILGHKMTDQAQAITVMGSRGRETLGLSVGEYILSGIMAGSTVKVIHTPQFETTDMGCLFGEFRGSSHPLPTPFPNAYNLISGNDLNQGGKQTELDSEKLLLLRRMIQKEESQQIIVSTLFSGMRNSDAIAEYRKYLAALIQPEKKED